MNERRIELMPLEDIQGAARNPKDHDIGELSKSVGRFGFTEAPLLDERTGRLVAGHGRIETLKALQARPGSKPPEGVKVDANGSWLVPVLRGWASRSDRDAEAYLLASNRLTELGGWKEAELAELLEGLAKDNALEGVGWDANDVEKLVALASPEAADDAGEVPKDAWVKPGQIFILGDHRLMCGSSTSEVDVRRLLDGATPVLMVTDPPYGIEYDPEWRERALGTSVKSKGRVTNDDQVDWSDAYRLFPGATAYVWHADRFAAEVAISLANEGFEVRSQIIWAKPSLSISRGHYHGQHEPCWYAVRRGKTANWHGDRKQSTLWQVARGKTGEDAPGEDSKAAHSTQKPVELYRRAYSNSSAPGEGVYEPFSGSGTAIIAAEILGRRCFAMELEPRYVQQAISRWEKLTGRKAVALDG